MNCEEYTNLLSGHLDGQNTQAEEQALQAHLDECPQCRALLNELERNDRLLSEVPAPPEALTAEIMKKVRAKKRRKKPLYRYFLPAASLATAAILALAVFGAMNLPVLAAKKAVSGEPFDAYFELKTNENCENGESYLGDSSGEQVTISMSAAGNAQDCQDYSDAPVMVIWYDGEEPPISGLTALDVLPYTSNSLFSSVLGSLLSPSAPMTENIQAAMQSVSSSVEAYTFPYSRLDEIFDGLIDSYEVAVFYPVGIPDEDATCLLLLAQILE